jgi:predicted alpha/beta superfamily hydrolase
VLEYPEIFGKAGVFSPAIWIGPAIFDEIKNKGMQVNSKIYFYAGKMESETMVPDMQKAIDLLQKVSASEIKVRVLNDGKHNEATWRREFPLFYKWMME